MFPVHLDTCGSLQALTGTQKVVHRLLFVPVFHPHQPYTPDGGRG